MTVAWPFDPSVYAGLAIFALGYAVLVRGRDDWSRRHGAWFLAGVLVLWAALESPLDVVADQQLQSMHMAQHVLIGLIAPPLLLLGLSPSLAAALARVPGVRPLTEPVPAQLAAAAVMVGWHIPALYDVTLASEAVHVFEHLSFIGSGLLFWWPVLTATGNTAGWRLGELGKLGYLLIGTFPQDGVAIVLQFSRDLFYPWYGEVGHRIPGWDPVIDQNVAGTVLQLFGKTGFLVAATAIFYRWVARDRAEEGELLSDYR